MKPMLLTQETFGKLLGEVREWLHGPGQGVTMEAVLMDMLATDEPWVDAELVRLLDGHHGPDLQEECVGSICFGIERNKRFYCSFATMCADRLRLDLFRAVAGLGLPELESTQSSAALHVDATTPAGVWLDLLCSTQAKTHPEEGVQTLPRRIVSLARNNPRAAALFAELLIEHDPGHGHIGLLETSCEGFALYTQALMHRRLQSTTSSTQDDSIAAPARRPVRSRL